MPWLFEGDEGRSLVAISFGEVPSNLWSEDLRMRKLDSVKRNHFGRKLIMQTQGSKTFQYLVENRPIGISLVAASEKERAQTVYAQAKAGL